MVHAFGQVVSAVFNQDITARVIPQDCDDYNITSSHNQSVTLGSIGRKLGLQISREQYLRGDGEGRVLGGVKIHRKVVRSTVRKPEQVFEHVPARTRARHQTQ